MRAGYARGIAREFAGECPRYGVNNPVYRRDETEIVRDMIDAGTRETDLKQALAKIKNERQNLQNQAGRYVISSGVVFGVPETFCRAADNERKAGGLIGRYLKPV